MTGRLWYLALVATVIGCSVQPDAASDDRVVVESVESEETTFRVLRVADGLEHPWAMAFLPDGRILITERPGRLTLLSAGPDREAQVIDGLPEIASVGQGGLLDIALHPDYEENGWIYFTYSAPGDGGAGTALSRARLSGESLTDLEELFRMEPFSRGGRHFGSRIVFAPDGSLFLTIGNRGRRGSAQDLQDHAGSTLRLAPDGGVPADNPFVGRSDALPEIYSYGHRNAQGMAVHPQSGAIWQHEHGPQGGDEVNILRAGANYGWDVISHGEEYGGGQVGEGTHKEGMEQPVVYWVPSIAPSGMAFYTGSELPEWRGDIFVGALAGRHLRRLVVEGQEIVHQEPLLDGALGRIRDVASGPDGALWLLTDADNGGLYRIEAEEE
jgi:glucose/arabinose dehydrogenase